MVGLSYETICWLAEKFDAFLRHLARDVRIQAHDARIDVADPGADDSLLNSSGQAARDEAVAEAVQFPFDAQLGKHSFQGDESATLGDLATL